MAVTVISISTSPRATVMASPTLTSRAALTRAPLRRTWPLFTASAATLRVLNRRTHQSHLSIRRLADVAEAVGIHVTRIVEPLDERERLQRGLEPAGRARRQNAAWIERAHERRSDPGH